ncbi:MAG TPA: hypothetical protein VIJ22_06735 [Polyangiaceae bacterium]
MTAGVAEDKDQLPGSALRKEEEGGAGVSEGGGVSEGVGSRASESAVEVGVEVEVEVGVDERWDSQTAAAAAAMTRDSAVTPMSTGVSVGGPDHGEAHRQPGASQEATDVAHHLES